MDKKRETHSLSQQFSNSYATMHPCEYFFSSIAAINDILSFHAPHLIQYLVLTLTITLRFFVYLFLLLHGSIDWALVMLQWLLQSGGVWVTRRKVKKWAFHEMLSLHLIAKKFIQVPQLLWVCNLTIQGRAWLHHSRGPANSNGGISLDAFAVLVWPVVRMWSVSWQGNCSQTEMCTIRL